MTDSKKSATSASSSKSTRSEAQKKSFNPINAVPNPSKARPERYLYGGMLFPSRIHALKENQSLEREAK